MQTVYTAEKIAKYFLWKAGQDKECGELMTNLKLQKLLYYAQGFYLAMHHGKPLFKDEIRAWAHGPVVPSVYKLYKNFSSNPISIEVKNSPTFSNSLKNFLDDIYHVFSQFSAWKLRDMTHDEPPWRESRPEESGVITHASMLSYFKTQLIK